MVPDRARAPTSSHAFRPAAWVLSLAVHATAAALLLGMPMQVRPEQERRPETVEVVFATALSEPDEADVGSVEPELSAPSRQPPAPEPAVQPLAEAAPSPSPTTEPVPALSIPTPGPDVQTPPVPLPPDQPQAETLVSPAPPQPAPAPLPADQFPAEASGLPVPPQPDPAPLSTAVPPPAAPPSSPPRRPTPRPKSKPVQRRPSPPRSAIAAKDESAPARPAPALASGSQGTLAPAATPAPLAAGPPVIDPSWRSALGAWMQAHRRYPDAARQRGEEGTVEVAFTVSRDGTVLTVQIVRPSGSALLDQAVHDMLTSQKVPAFPAGMTQAQAHVAVNVHFSLDR